MPIHDKKVAILVHNYFEQPEFEQPLQALKDAGAEVHVIAAGDTKQLQAMQQDTDKSDMFQADLLLVEANPDDYDALILPGGTVNADNLRMVDGAQEWVKGFMGAQKPVAAICHAPWVLISSGVIKGKRLTSYPSLRDDAINAGAEWVDEEVVVDGNLITSRNPDDLPAFCSAIIGSLT